MSDQSQGPGWWLASDGRWYPPAATPGVPPPPPPPPSPSTSPYGPPPYGTPYGTPPSMPPPSGAIFTGPVGPPPYYGIAPPPPPAASTNPNKGCWIAFLIVMGVGVVFIGVVVVGLVTVGNRVSNAEKKARESAQKTCANVTYSGSEVLDHCADSNNQVMDQGYTVTATPLKLIPGRYDGAQIRLCTTITYFNRADGESAYGPYEWSLQSPSGEITEPLMVGGTLASGRLAPRGQVSGDVCFLVPNESGTFVLIWKPNTFNPDRGIWLTTR